MKLRITLVAVCAMLAPGCLEEHRRGGDNDGADTGGGDSASDADTGGETTDPCGALDCNDGDPCTVDSCIDGQCAHASSVNDAMPPEGSCTGDADCADDSPCTTDRCVVANADCGGTSGTCVHEAVPGCNLSCSSDNQCVDGDPCTLDTCAGLICAHEVIGDGLCSSQCNPSLARAVGDIAQSTGGNEVPVVARGVVQMIPIPCPACAGCPCTGGARLTDESGLGLDLSTEPPATCTTTGGPLVCEPIQAGPRYLVWGTTQWGPVPFSGGDGGEAGVAAPATALDVEGFCREPTPDNVTGDYDATLSRDGEVALEFRVTIVMGSQQAPVMTFSQVVDPLQNWDAARFEAQRAPIGFVDARLEIDLALTPRNAPDIAVHARLFGRDNGFSGAVAPLSQGFVLPGEPTLQLDLQRRNAALPPER